MYIKRIIKKIPKTPIFEPYCENKFQQLLKDLNITIVSLTMGKKDEIDNEDKKKKERCD
jgi:hypothetical protein